MLTGPQSGPHQADQRHRLDEDHRRHGGLRVGQGALRLGADHRRRRGPDHHPVVAGAGGPGHLDPAAYPGGQLDLRGRRRARTPPARSASRSTVPRSGSISGVALGAWISGQHLLFNYDVVQSGEGVGNELIYIVGGRHRRLSADRRLRLGGRRGGGRLHLRHDEQGHRLRAVGAGLVQVLPGGDAACSPPCSTRGYASVRRRTDDRGQGRRDGKTAGRTGRRQTDAGPDKTRRSRQRRPAGIDACRAGRPPRWWSWRTSASSTATSGPWRTSRSRCTRARSPAYSATTAPASRR